MDPVRLAVSQPVTVIVGVILILLAGTVALTRLPIALTPNVQDTIVTVRTFWEGASPEEIEQNVVDKQEERLLGLSNLVQITSSSAQDTGVVRLVFRTGVSKEEALREVAQKLDEVPDYPENVDQPVIEATDPENRDYIAWVVLACTDPDVDVREFRDFAIDRIEPRLERVPGIAEINVLGGREREMQIRVDPMRLAERGITPTRFAQVIQDVNRNVSAGQVADGKRDYRMRLVSQYASAREIEATVIERGSGGTVRVGDVATATIAYKEPTSFVRSRGEPVIAINADRELDSNIIEVMAGLRAAIDELNAEDGLLAAESRRIGLDGRLTLEQVYDQTVYIDQALALVRGNIWVGGGLAVFVLLLFLRSIRSVGIIALAIPISVVGAIVAMVALGRSINVISLAGMAFAVGMVVDNAIVVLENIFRHLEMGKPPPQAAIDGASEVWGAVLASTLTTVAVFVPILLIQDEAGQLFRDIALAICAAVTLSLVVSITLIPTASARILRARRKKAGSGASNGPRRNVIADGIAGFVHLLLGSKLVSLGVVAALTIISIIGTQLLRPPADYLPQGNRNLVFGLMIPPPGFNLAHREAIAERVEETMRPYWEAGRAIDRPETYAKLVDELPSVPTFDWMANAPGPDVTPPSVENYFIVSFEGILFHGAISDDERRVVDLQPLFAEATGGDAAPDVIAFAFQVPLFQLGGSTGSAIKLQLSGPDLEAVKAAAGQMFFELGGIYGFQSVQPDPPNFTLRNPEIRVRPDLVRLSELGLDVRDVALAVQVAGDGAIVDEFTESGESIDLKIISADAVDRTVRPMVEAIPIAAPGGRTVTLASVAEVIPVQSPQAIARVGRQRSVTLQITPPPGTPLEQVVSDLGSMIQRYRDDGRLGSSITADIAGSASKLEQVQNALLGDGSIGGTLSSSLVLALIVVYLLMCVLFQDFLRPLVIMFSVPLATLGGFMALFAVFIWSAGDRYAPMQMLDVLTMLGFVLLIGVVVNNALLIVHQATNFLEGRGDLQAGQLARYGGRMTPRAAITLAVRTRVRPIFMSTLTSVGGMLPLVLTPGAGSELYRGLGSVVVGGLIVSTIFTLLLVPLLLGLVMRMPRRPEDAALSSGPGSEPGSEPSSALGLKPASGLNSSSRPGPTGVQSAVPGSRPAAAPSPQGPSGSSSGEASGLSSGASSDPSPGPPPGPSGGPRTGGPAASA
ncbi:MAG: efflux RND transporter permease subunit [Phycisphaerales bacterium]